MSARSPRSICRAMAYFMRQNFAQFTSVPFSSHVHIFNVEFRKSTLNSDRPLHCVALYFHYRRFDELTSPFLIFLFRSCFCRSTHTNQFLYNIATEIFFLPFLFSVNVVSNMNWIKRVKISTLFEYLDRVPKTWVKKWIECRSRKKWRIL